MSLILFRGEHVSNNQEQHYITDGGANAKKVEADFPKVVCSTVFLCQSWYSQSIEAGAFNND